MINNTAVENKHPTEANIDTVYPITFSGATDSGGLPMFKVTLTYADGSSKELEYNVDYKLVYDDVQENNNESFNKPHLNGIKFLLPEYAVDGNTLYILRTTPFVQPVDFQIGRIDPEQIEKIADLSVLRDQEIRNQANKDRDNISDLYDITAGLRTDVDTAQDSADAAMAHSVALETRVSVNETGIATNKSAVAIAQKTASDAMAHTVAVEKRVAVNETGIATNKSAAARAQETASDAMAHTVAVEKRVTQAEKNITSNDGDIAKIFSHQEKQDGRLTNLENSKQDKLTAGDNIIISGNVISATGAGGGAGFDMQVVDQLPATGKKGVIYLVPKDGTAPDVYDEYVWITATQTFELIGSTKVDLSDYLPLSGGTLTGGLEFRYHATKNGLGFAPNDSISFNALQLGIFANNGFSPYINFGSTGNVFIHPTYDNTTDIGSKNNRWTSVYATKLNNGADLAIPTEGGTLARLEDLENIDALPDQTDNAGKFLTTDGTTASWSDKPLVNKAASPTFSLGIVGTATGVFTTAAGVGSVASNGGTAFGYNSQASASYGVAVGQYAQINKGYAIQLGKGTNDDTNTFKVGNQNGNYEIMSADGTIPADRMSATTGTTGQVLTKTDTGMNWQDAAGGAKIIIRRGI